MSEQKSTLGRRQFLKKAAVGGGVAAGVAAVAVSKGSQAEAAVTESNGNAAGYQVTDHVKQYYELAKF